MLPQRRHVDADTICDDSAIECVDLEELVRVRPQCIERRLRPVVTFIGAVTQAHHPRRGMPEMVPGFLQRFGGDPCQGLVSRIHEAFEQEDVELREEKLLYDG